MDRRRFSISGLCTLAASIGLCTRQALANLATQGCRMAGAGDANFGDNVLSASTVAFTAQWQQRLSERFAVRPALRGYLDSIYSMNAIAIADAMFPSEGPDGTVLLGLNLVKYEIQRAVELTANRQPHFGDEAIVLILAHEWAHILQFKSGMSPDGPWQMEPHADFLGGWFLGQSGPVLLPQPEVPDIENAARAMFEKGDTAFNDPSHHGPPQFRAAMVRAGYEAGQRKLGIRAAFERGRILSGLK